MTWIKKIVYILGMNKEPMLTEELVKKMYGEDNVYNNYRYYSLRAYSNLNHYKQFFKKEIVLEDGKRKMYRSLSKNGWKFFENIKDIYDPETDMEVIPQLQWVDYIKNKSYDEKL